MASKLNAAVGGPVELTVSLSGDGIEVTKVDNGRLREIRKALSIVTHDLTAGEAQEVWCLVHALATRMTAETWAHEIGRDVPPADTLEFEQLLDDWASSPDDE